VNLPQTTVTNAIDLQSAAYSFRAKHKKEVVQCLLSVCLCGHKMTPKRTAVDEIFRNGTKRFTFHHDQDQNHDTEIANFPSKISESFVPNSMKFLGR